MQPSRELAIAPSAAPPRTAVRAVEAGQCLIVAADDARRDNLGFAAREGGWDVTTCGDVASAVTHARQRLLQMAIVDLSDTAAANRASFRFLVEQLACTSRMLILVCGSVDDPREEIWARHLGVWMYLPGAIDGTELVGLCVAARETVERLTAASRQQCQQHETKFYRSS